MTGPKEIQPFRTIQHHHVNPTLPDQHSSLRFKENGTGDAIEIKPFRVGMKEEIFGSDYSVKVEEANPPLDLDAREEEPPLKLPVEDSSATGSATPSDPDSSQSDPSLAPILHPSTMSPTSLLENPEGPVSVVKPESPPLDLPIF